MSRLVSRKQRIWSGLVCILRKFNNAVFCLPPSRSASSTALFVCSPYPECTLHGGSGLPAQPAVIRIKSDDSNTAQHTATTAQLLCKTLKSYYTTSGGGFAAGTPCYACSQKVRLARLSYKALTWTLGKF